MGERLLFTTAGTGALTPYSRLGSSTPGGSNGDQQLPVTLAEAVAAGWKDPVLCTPGRGRFFRKETEGEAVPYFLMYDRRDALIGVYQRLDDAQRLIHVVQLFVNMGNGLNDVSELRIELEGLSEVGQGAFEILLNEFAHTRFVELQTLLSGHDVTIPFPIKNN